MTEANTDYVEETDIVTYEAADGIAWITMNRPKYNNAQNGRMTYELDAAFMRAVADDDVKVIVLKGEGKHFSAGHDIGTPGRDVHLSQERVTSWYDHANKPGGEYLYVREAEAYLGMCRRWRDIPKPTIAAVQGACMAGCYANHVNCGCADASVTHCEEIKLRPTRVTRERIFHTGHKLRERVRPQASISRSPRLAGREFVRANGGRPGQEMRPAYGMAEDPLTIGGTREQRRSTPRSRVALAPERGLRARAAGEPAGASPPGDARPGFVYLGRVRSCNMSTSS